MDISLQEDPRLQTCKSMVNNTLPRNNIAHFPRPAPFHSSGMGNPLKAGLQCPWGFLNSLRPGPDYARICVKTEPDRAHYVIDMS